MKLLWSLSLVWSLTSIAGQLALAEEKSAPYLAATFEALSPTGEVIATDTRVSRLVALYIPSDERPTPFLPAGPFRVTWEGFLEVDFFDEYSFKAEGRGAVEVEINGQSVLKAEGDDFATAASSAVELEGGKQPLVVRYRSPKTGPAVLRLDWVGFDFPQGEPLLPSLLTHDPSGALLLKGHKLRLAREALATRRCLKCHVPQAGSAPLESGMPELQMDAPSFEGIGDRLHADWMARWIDNPQSIRKTATMPRMFRPAKASDGGLDQRCLDIAAFLETQKTNDAPSPGTPKKGAAAHGAQLFDELGCIACHSVDRDNPRMRAQKGDGFDRISLNHIPEKWKQGQLWRFLKEPERHYQWTRMPNFRLSDGEAEALEAFLLPASTGKPAKGDARRGQTLVETSGCLNCHSLKIENRFNTARLEEVLASGATKGCLATDDALRGNAPHFEFSTGEREALATFDSSAVASLHARSPQEFAGRQFQALRCWSCHVRDGVVDVWSHLEERGSGDQPKKPAPTSGEGHIAVQNRPHLTWVGEKLRPGWLEGFLSGDAAYAVRPWFTARMPKFSTRAKLLAQGLAMEHGFAPTDQTREPKNPKLAEAGKKLIGRDFFACVGCHDVGSTKAVGVFDAKGTNLQLAATRLRESFYYRWMLDPVRVSPETKMPAFVSEGRSPFDLFEHDGRKQFEAIWHHFLELGEK